MSKSKLYGVGVMEEEIQSWASTLGCGSGRMPFLYLGLLIGASVRKVANWLLVIERTKSKLSDWKAKLISFRGR